LNPEGEFTVTFDAIDGGTIIDTNYSVSSIFGIWKAMVNGSTGRDL
jgi:fructose-1,6-bisphosphatase